jgi:putative endonuclease
LAARFLQKAGYKVLYRNYKPTYGGEVDLVCRARMRMELVFVEVKTRSSEAYGSPEEAVNWEKQRRIVRAAQEWLEQLEVEEVTVRFDIVEVILYKGHQELRRGNPSSRKRAAYPGGQPRGRPPKTWTWRCGTDSPPSAPWLMTTRNPVSSTPVRRATS